MTDDILDKYDKYSPIRFSRNYFDEPTKVQPYWISKVYVRNLVGVGRPDGTAEIDMLGKPALTAPNGYGKTLLLKLINAVMELANGYEPLSLRQLVKTVVDSDWDSYVKYHHLFDEISVELVDGQVFRLAADDYTNGSYVFEAAGNLYPIHARAEYVCPSPFVHTGVCMLPASRLNPPESYIYNIVALMNGNIDYGFINNWYRVMMQGAELDDPTSNTVKRYVNVPFDYNKSFNANCKDITHWCSELMLSHGELELFMQLLAMSSGCKLVLIDSAEIGFYPGVQVCYMNLLSAMYQKGVQVLFSTHSPTMFDMNFSYSNDLCAIFDQKE